MITFFWILGFLSALVMVCAIVKVAADMYAELQRVRKVAATKRVEAVDGKDYVVVTRPLPVIREKRTGRIGFLLERGSRNMPTTINGHIALVPQWVKVQFIRKSDGRAGREEWRSYEKFETIGEADVDFLTRPAGWFQTELLMRYSADVGRSKSAHHPKPTVNPF